MASAQWFPSSHFGRGAKTEERRQSWQDKIAKSLTSQLRIAGISTLVAWGSCDVPCAKAQDVQARPVTFQTDVGIQNQTQLVQPATNDPSLANNPRDAQAASPGSQTQDQAAPLNAQEDVTAQLLQSNELKLADVVASVYQSFPTVQQARLERARAQGLIVEAYGSYDTKLEAYTLNEPVGFYQNYRQGIGVARQTWWGTYLSAGYRIGRGVYEPWYLERETNKGGEFKLAMGIPLLQGRAIDAQRVAVFQANLDRQAAEPQIQQELLNMSREATGQYWEWLSTGAVLAAQRELLTLAERRGEQYQIGFKAGKFAEVDLILNNQLIAERRVKYFETQQKFQSSTFKLSLYLRDEIGQPLVAPLEWLPNQFPVIQPITTGDLQRDIVESLSRRPEPRLLQIELRKLQYEVALANNNLLPRVDVVTDASQDVGEPTSSKNDKGQFELNVGLTGEIALQRRKPLGKLQQTQAKIGQVSEKLRLQSNKIGIELQTAFNALQWTAQRVEQSEVALRAAYDTLVRYQFAFERGKADLIYINLLETKVNETEIKLIEAQRDWFIALADMQAALGLDPLDQAVQVSSLPKSERPGPNNLPELPLDPAKMQQDWQLREQR